MQQCSMDARLYPSAQCLLRRYPSGPFAAFFALSNLELLQKRIAEGVKETAGLKISRQSDDALFRLMMAVFEETAGDLACLNARVLDLAVPDIVVNATNHMRLQHFLGSNGRNELPMMPRPASSQL